MDLKTYQQRKEKFKKETDKFRTICQKCRRPSSGCLCSLATPIEMDIEVVILIHPKEFKKVKLGTGRLAHLCLKNSRLLMGIDFTNHSEVNRLINDDRYYPMVLYPGKGSYNISKSEFDPTFLSGRKPLLFIIDGTWPCAKKMMKLSSNLKKLPRLSFDVKEKSKFEIKQQPNDFCLSTIEAIYYFISEWKKNYSLNIEGNINALLEILSHLVTVQIDNANDPNLKSYRRTKGFRPPEVRIPSKKWLTRNIFFEE